tara:strand:+ start:373 stop:1032 length:660 start_codon:yes stop_codon:yes gene_type:complete
VNKSFLYLFLASTILTLLGCQTNENKAPEIDNNSYINDFELLQENPKNDYSIRIKSPRAILDSIKKDIQIYDGSIEILNKNGNDIIVKSGKSTLNNSSNLIKVFNNVNISLLETNNYFITTDSFNWDINTSIIELYSPLYINFDTTKITSSSGSYDIKLGLLRINNNIFNRNILNKEGKERYQIEIISDIAKWLNNENSLEFNSKNKQVETTINFLTTK